MQALAFGIVIIVLILLIDPLTLICFRMGTHRKQHADEQCRQKYQTEPPVPDRMSRSPYMFSHIPPLAAGKL